MLKFFECLTIVYTMVTTWPEAGRKNWTHQFTVFNQANKSIRESFKANVQLLYVHQALLKCYLHVRSLYRCLSLTKCKHYNIYFWGRRRKMYKIETKVPLIMWYIFFTIDMIGTDFRTISGQNYIILTCSVLSFFTSSN